MAERVGAGSPGALPKATEPFPSLSLPRLPIFLTRELKYPLGALWYVVGALLYLASNWIHFSTPHLMSLWWVDRAIPFLPHAVWIYVSEYVFFAAVYITCRDMVNANKYLYSSMSLQAVSVAIFFLWPTTYPRGDFPLPHNLDALTYWVFNTLRSADSPANCCPSLHVSSVFLSSFIFLDEQREKFPWFFAWGAAIAVSTLPTKQHYVVDVISGLGMAVLFYAIFHRLVRYRWTNYARVAPSLNP